MSTTKEKINRPWVKNAAIIFLAVMLVLTFFSKTIMNISLTEVTGQYMNSGKISSDVRGTGTVTANMAYNVQLEEQRTVKEVLISSGDSVEQDQVLFILEEGDNAALEEAEQTLADMQFAYNTKLIQTVDANYASENANIQSIRNNLAEAGSQLSEALAGESVYNTAKAAASSAQRRVNELQQTIADLQAAIAVATMNDPQMQTLNAELSAAQREKTQAETALTAAQANTAAAQSRMSISLEAAEAVLTSAQRMLADMELELSYLQADYDAVLNDPSAEPSAVTEAQRAVERQEQAVANQEADVASAQAAYDNAVLLNAKLAAAQAAEAEAQSDLDAKNAAVTAAQAAVDARTAEVTTDLYNQLTAAQAELTSAQARLSTAQSNLSEAASNNTANVDSARANVRSLQQSLESALAALSEQMEADGVSAAAADLDLEHDREALEKQEALVEQLREEGTVNEVRAQYAGTISSVSVIAGDIVAPGTTMASINVAGKEYTLIITVTAEQSRKVSVGDAANITNTMWGRAEATLTAITDDPMEPGKNKILEFTVSGDVADGQSLSVSIGQKDEPYDLVVPKSALREDSNGTFVLIATSKSTPFGSRYIAQRLPVTVLAEDSYNAAIDTGTSSHEYVITTASGPVNPGDQVRITNK